MWPFSRVGARQIVSADQLRDIAGKPAASLGMGCMGVVYAVVLRAVDRFWLNESREPKTWSELTKPEGFLQKFLLNPRDPQFPDHIEITVSLRAASGSRARRALDQAQKARHRARAHDERQLARSARQWPPFGQARGAKDQRPSCS
jgi:hypothetical protein